jgi:predicted ABC-type ATPase
VIHAAFDERPIVVALAGPNGAGKSTFYKAFLADTGLPFVNADDIARESGLDPATAAGVAGEIRQELVRQRESFIFETVLSDPVGEKVAFLRDVAASGYTVVMCYIGISGPAVSDERVAMRVSQGGHDVPAEKLPARYARSLANLKRAMRDVPIVLVFDNDDLRAPYRRVAACENGARTFLAKPVPRWLSPLI